jgi:DNA modification methylase
MTDSPDRRRKPTATSNFGVGRRENHDASAFYGRFTPPELSDDDALVAPTPIDEPFQKGDSRNMEAVADGSVALVVTSPPYFAGKQYEEELERDGIPSSYVEYLELLTDVFADCKRTLEPGGRIAVNVANLGRKPYRSLSADVIRILQDDLGLLLRGEVVWRKGVGDVGAAGNCAWGSFRKPSNPVLRDVTERVVIASKGRFDRAQSKRHREVGGFPSKAAVDADEFMAATLDVWDLPPESAKRVRHPAPFPVALPERLILLYTYENDLVLDPFMGSGSTLVAAAQHGRRYIGYDLDPEYVDLARSRVEDVTVAPHAPDDGKAAAAFAAELIEAAGFTITHRNRKLRGTGLTVSYVATDATDQAWYFDVSGAFTTSRDGMLRTDTVWKSLGRAHVLANNNPDGIPLVFLTSDLPRPGSDGDTALRAAGPDAFFDAIALRATHDLERLRTYAADGPSSGPTLGFWTARDLERR